MPQLSVIVPVYNEERTIAQIQLFVMLPKIWLDCVGQIPPIGHSAVIDLLMIIALSLRELFIAIRGINVIIV